MSSKTLKKYNFDEEKAVKNPPAFAPGFGPTAPREEAVDTKEKNRICDNHES
jgi:hypothetical protein